MKLLRPTPPETLQRAQQLDLFSFELSSEPTLAPAAPRSTPLTQPGLGGNAPTEPFPPPLPTSPVRPVGGGRRRLQLRSHVLEYRLVRSKRRSIGFLIDDEGLRITAPKWVTVAEIESAIVEKERWIFAKLAERRERSARRLQPQMQWRDGAALPYMGADITLRILPGNGSGVSFDEKTRQLSVSLPPEAGQQQLKDRVQGWLQLEAKRVFGERLPLYAEKLGVQFKSFALSSATTQWGSCTSEGRIRLNWRLIHFALPLIDYVVAHELSHLREMNHSPRFWSTLQSVFPGFEAAKKALRDHPPEALPAF